MQPSNRSHGIPQQKLDDQLWGQGWKPRNEGDLIEQSNEREHINEGWEAIEPSEAIKQVEIEHPFFEWVKMFVDVIALFINYKYLWLQVQFILID